MDPDLQRHVAEDAARFSMLSNPLLLMFAGAFLTACGFLIRMLISAKDATLLTETKAAQVYVSKAEFASHVGQIAHIGTLERLAKVESDLASGHATQNSLLQRFDHLEAKIDAVLERGRRLEEWNQGGKT